MFPKSPNVFHKITFTYMVLHNFTLTHSRFGIYTYNMSKTIYSHNTANVYHAPHSCLPSLHYGHQITPPPLIWLQFTLKEFLIGSKGIFEEQSGNIVSNHEHTSVGQVFVFLYNSQFQVFENKKFKELPRSGVYIFRRFKESLGSRS